MVWVGGQEKEAGTRCVLLTASASAATRARAFSSAAFQFSPNTYSQTTNSRGDPERLTDERSRPKAATPVPVSEGFGKLSRERCFLHERTLAPHLLKHQGLCRLWHDLLERAHRKTKGSRREATGKRIWSPSRCPAPQEQRRTAVRFEAKRRRTTLTCMPSRRPIVAAASPALPPEEEMTDLTPRSWSCAHIYAIPRSLNEPEG